MEIDLTGPLPKSESGCKFIITAIDKFSRWVEVMPIKRKTVSIVVKFIFDKILLIHGAPERILTDQGKEFMNEVYKEITTFLNIKRSRMSIFNPKCSGAVERFNQTLINILCKYCNEDVRD